jgi:hypothetical protein
MSGVRYFFLIVFAVVASGVIYFIPRLAADGRWDVIAFFISLLVFIAWRVWSSIQPPA